MKLSNEFNGNQAESQKKIQTVFLPLAPLLFFIEEYSSERSCRVLFI